MQGACLRVPKLLRRLRLPERRSHRPGCCLRSCASWPYTATECVSEALPQGHLGTLVEESAEEAVIRVMGGEELSVRPSCVAAVTKPTTSLRGSGDLCPAEFQPLGAFIPACKVVLGCQAPTAGQDELGWRGGISCADLSSRKHVPVSSGIQGLQPCSEGSPEGPP